MFTVSTRGMASPGRHLGAHLPSPSLFQFLVESASFSVWKGVCLEKDLRILKRQRGRAPAVHTVGGGGLWAAGAPATVLAAPVHLAPHSARRGPTASARTQGRWGPRRT